MPPAKKYPVKLKVSPAYLETLPVFAAPKPKSRAKKLSSEEKKNAASPNSAAGLAMNSGPQVLDKSGRPCRRWRKTPFQFKTFSGFKVGLGVWRPESVGNVKTEEKTGGVGELDRPEQPSIAI
ncbi:hypothetical protein OXX69_011613 [Metschnikowia pulcherrima]